MKNRIIETDEYIFYLESIKKYLNDGAEIVYFNGWLLNKTNNSFELALYLGEDKLSLCENVWYERDDVAKKYHKNTDDKYGFTIGVSVNKIKSEKIEDINFVFEQNKLYKVIESLSKNIVDKIEIENKIVNNIDWVLESSERLRLVGWGYGCTGDIQFGNLEIEVLDANGKNVEYKMHRVYRKDVNGLININCSPNDLFGYEIDWKKTKAEKYIVKYKYENLLNEVEILVNSNTNKKDEELDENLWTLPDANIINEHIYLSNVENIYVTKNNTIYFSGWIDNVLQDSYQFEIIENGKRVDSQCKIVENCELNRYDFDLEVNLKENFKNVQIIASNKQADLEIANFDHIDYSKYKFESSIFTYTDEIKIDKAQVRLVGWSYFNYLPHHYKTVDICIKNANGEIQKVVEKRFVRKDVSAILSDKKDELVKWAYILEWECGDNDEFYIEYSGEDIVKRERIDVSELKREERERSYSYPTKDIMRRNITWQRIKDDLYYINKKGIKEFRDIYNDRVGKKEIIYNEWRKWNSPTKAELEKQKKCVFDRMPKISIIVPTYRTPDKFLREMLDSVVNQTYSNWELCIGDGSMDDSVIPVLEEYHNKDSRIVYKKLEENYGISGNTNGALELATGDFIALLDHDDLLTPDALYEVVKAINIDSTVDVVYTDEDKVSLDLQTYFEPHFKPDFNIDLLRSCNYICHFFVVDKKIVDQVGGFRSECDGSQDYDFILRCTSAASRIEHVAKCVYNWRCHPASTAMNPESKLYCYESGKRALEYHLKDSNIEGVSVKIAENYGYYRVSYPIKNQELVSLVWITERKNNDDFISNIKKKSSYQDIEFIPVYKKDEEQNNSELLNSAAKNANGKYILFIHDGIEVVTENWIEILLSNCMRNEVGIVSAKVYNLSNEIVHAGYVTGLRGIASRIFVGKQYNDHGYEARLLAQCDMSAVSRDCMIISKELFMEIGGFDENLTKSYEDVDLCFEVRKRNLLVVFTSYAEIKCDIEMDETDLNDEEYMKGKWHNELTKGDYSYNKNFSLERGDFEL